MAFTPKAEAHGETAVELSGCSSRKAVRRLAVVLSTDEQPQWVAILLKRLLDEGEVDVRRVSLVTPCRERVVDGAPPLLWRLCRRLDAFLFGRQANSLRAIDLRPLLAGIPGVQLAGTREPAFDVALDLTGGAPARQLAKLAAEIWTYSAPARESMDTLLLRLRLRGAASIRTELVSREASGTSARLFEARSSVDRWSNLRTTANCYQKAPAIIHACLAGGGASTRLIETRREQIRPAAGPCPTNLQTVRSFTVFCRRYARERVRRALHTRRWELAVAAIPDGQRLQEASFRKLTPPEGCFWADPFPLMQDGRCFVYFEEFVRADRRGRIMVAECDQRGLLSAPECVLSRPYHLSYPLVFNSGGALYMVPESRANHTIEVYECVSFPQKWELCRVLFRQIEASDPTPAFIGDRWWLFANIGTSSSAYDDLYLFYANNPLGPWTPHVGNPVKSDARSGRSAGRIVAANGKIYRLSQDCSRRYGYAVNAHEITRLDPWTYEARWAGRITPRRSAKALSGVHTANATRNLIFIDGLVERSRLPFADDDDPFQDLRIRGCGFWCQR